MIYHLLPELEQFCMRRGGAISKNVSNIMRFDDSRVVVCSASDSLWGFPPERIIVIPEVLSYGKLKGHRFLPSWITGPFFRHVFRPLLSRLEEGDIVWCHNQPYFAAALEQAVHAKGAKFILHAHDPYVPRTARIAFASFNPDAWVFVSESLRQRFLRLLPGLKNSYAVYNGADERLFYPLPEEARQTNAVPVVLYVGRLHSWKGAHVLMEAMRILQKRSVPAHCRVVGSSFSGGSKATSYVRSLHRSSPANVEFAPYRDATEIAQEYRAADILCCPSIWQEAFGNVNIEAMACGIPVVATRVGGIPEIAADGGIYLVEPDSAVEIADGLQKLIEDRELRLRMGAEGIESFRRRFTWSVVCKEYQNIAASVCAQGRETVGAGI
jgi:spore coat protein SA